MPIASRQVAKHRCGLLTELVQPLRRHQTTGEVERSGHAAGSTIAVSLTRSDNNALADLNKSLDAFFFRKSLDFNPEQFQT